MAMLSEPRQRKRYNLVPRGKALYEDESRFGTKMLEKMGWQKGKGLGANENGLKDFVRIRYKNDALGFGFKEQDNQWTQHEQSFNGLLKTLNNGAETEGFKTIQELDHNTEEDMPYTGFGFNNFNTQQKKTTGETLKEKISGISLEERSKQSKARVHYKKFTKGKDLAQYSEKDLANIFGKKATDEQQAANDFYQQLSNTFNKEQEINSDDAEVNNYIKGVQIINTGVSVNDYFKMKMQAVKQKNDIDIGEDSSDMTKANKKNNMDKDLNENGNDLENKDGQMTYSEVSVTDYFKMKMEAAKNRKHVLKDADSLEDTKTTTDEVQKEEVRKKKKKCKKEKKDQENEINYPEKEIEYCEKTIKKKSKSKKNDENLKSYLDKDTHNKKKTKKTNKSQHLECETQNKIHTDKTNGNLTNMKGELDNLPTDNIMSHDLEKPNIEIDITTEPVKKKHKKRKNMELNDTITIFDKEPSTEKKIKLQEFNDKPVKEENSTNYTQAENASSQKTIKSSKKSKHKTDVSSSAKNVFISDANIQQTDLDELKEKYSSFNIYSISSFCAEKFRNISLNDFTGSSLPQIEGYGFDPDLQLNVQINKYDEERITNLWKGVLNKYDHMDKPKKIYRNYVREVIKARKAKQKGPKLYVKTWKRKNAFQII